VEPAAQVPPPDGRLPAAGGSVRHAVELPVGVQRAHGAGQTEYEAGRLRAHVRRAARRRHNLPRRLRPPPAARRRAETEGDVVAEPGRARRPHQLPQGVHAQRTRSRALL